MSDQLMREAFERWATSQPDQWDIRRYRLDPDVAVWPGAYLRFHVQCAWDAWQAGWHAAQAAKVTP